MSNLSGLCSCFPATRSASPHAGHASPHKKRVPNDGTALGESAQMDDSTGEAALRMQLGASISGRGIDSPCADVPSTIVREILPETSSSLASWLLTPLRAVSLVSKEKPQHHQQMQTTGAALITQSSLKGGRTAAASAVRFATAPEADGCNGHRADATNGPCGGTSRPSVGSRRSVGSRSSRVRVLLPSASEKKRPTGSGDCGGGVDESSTAMLSEVPRSLSTVSQSLSNVSHLSTTWKHDGEPRALAELVSRLLSHQVDYRGELEAIMSTHGSVFPQPLLEEMLRKNGVEMSQRRLRIINTLYLVEGHEGDLEDKIDGLALLKDLDRAAFRHIAQGAGNGGPGVGVSGAGGENGPSGTSTAASSRKSLTVAQLADKTRILQLVASQMAQDETMRMCTGSSEMALVPEHLQDAVEQLDLTSVAVPVGTRAPYVHSTDDPDSFQVPVWSLRAMLLRKQRRDQVLTGADPHLKSMGQAGREALRKKLTSRSIFQQQEIIANAVVAAARAAVAPAFRLTENSIQLAGPAKLDNMRRTGASPVRGSVSTIYGTPNRRSSTSVTANIPFRGSSIVPAESAFNTSTTSIATLRADFAVGLGAGLRASRDCEGDVPEYTPLFPTYPEVGDSCNAAGGGGSSSSNNLTICALGKMASSSGDADDAKYGSGSGADAARWMVNLLGSDGLVSNSSPRVCDNNAAQLFLPGSFPPLERTPTPSRLGDDMGGGDDSLVPIGPKPASPLAALGGPTHEATDWARGRAISGDGVKLPLLEVHAKRLSDSPKPSMPSSPLAPLSLFQHPFPPQQQPQQWGRTSHSPAGTDAGEQQPVTAAEAGQPARTMEGLQSQPRFLSEGGRGSGIDREGTCDDEHSGSVIEGEGAALPSPGIGSRNAGDKARGILPCQASSAAPLPMPTVPGSAESSPVCEGRDMSWSAHGSTTHQLPGQCNPPVLSSCCASWSPTHLPGTSAARSTDSD